MDNKTTKFPSNFIVTIADTVQELNNSGYSKARVNIFYDKLNRNGTYFSKEVAEQMLLSLPGTPVVGYYDDDLEDFTTHESIKVTRPIGFVPENANIEWENIVDDDGVTKSYASADVILWTARYPEAKLVVGKSHSMELNPETMQGSFQVIDGNYCFVVTKAEFYGLCVLGDNVEPCFEDSKFYNLNYTNIKNEFAEMVRDYSQALENIKGGQEMGKTIAEEVDKKLAEEEINEAVNPDVVPNPEVPELEVPEEGEAKDGNEGEELNEGEIPNESEVPEAGEGENPEAVESEGENPSESESNEGGEADGEAADSYDIDSLNYEQLREILVPAVRNLFDGYLENFDNVYVYVCDYYDSCTYRYNYSIKGIEVIIAEDTKTKVISNGYREFSAVKAEDIIEEKEVEIKDLKAELEELKSYKLNKVKEEKIETLNSFKNKISESNYNLLKDKIDNYADVLEVKKEIGLMIIEEMNDDTVVSEFAAIQENQAKTGVEALIAKHINR